MITALISSVLGMAGGLLPDIFKEFRAGREHKRELERMDKTAELQLKMLRAQTDARLAEVEGNVVVEELRAHARQMEAIYRAQAPTGIRWVDALNATIRPLTALLLMVLFIATAAAYAWSLIGSLEAVGPEDWGRVSLALWGSLVGEAMQAVLGYLFGMRTTSAAVRLRRPG